MLLALSGVYNGMRTLDGHVDEQIASAVYSLVANRLSGGAARTYLGRTHAAKSEE